MLYKKLSKYTTKNRIATELRQNCDRIEFDFFCFIQNKIILFVSSKFNSNSMKKTMYALLTLVVFVGALNINITGHSDQIPAIYLSNIETLSYAESSENRCFGTGSIDCPSSSNKVKIIF